MVGFGRHLLTILMILGQLRFLTEVLQSGATLLDSYAMKARSCSYRVKQPTNFRTYLPIRSA